jgi:hypothetical protein
MLRSKSGGGTDASRRFESDRARFCNVSVQSLPETVQLPRPPGIWTVPGAFVFSGLFFLGRW